MGLEDTALYCTDIAADVRSLAGDRNEVGEPREQNKASAVAIRKQHRTDLTQNGSQQPLLTSAVRLFQYEGNAFQGLGSPRSVTYTHWTFRCADRATASDICAALVEYTKCENRLLG